MTVKLNALISKATQAKLDSEKLRRENVNLKKELEKLNSSLQVHRREAVDLDKQIIMARNDLAEERSNAIKISRKEIDKMIKYVDQCLAWLNDKETTNE